MDVTAVTTSSPPPKNIHKVSTFVLHWSKNIGGSEHCVLAWMATGLNQLVLVLGATCNAAMTSKLCNLF